MPDPTPIPTILAAMPPPPSRQLRDIAELFLGVPALPEADEDAVVQRAIRLRDLSSLSLRPDAPLPELPFRRSRAVRARVRENDLLLAARGSLSHAVLVPPGSPFVDAVATENLLIVRLHEDAGVRPSVLALLLDHGGELRERVTSRGALFHLSPDELRTWPVPILPAAVQDALEEAFLALRASIAAAERANHARGELLRAMAFAVRSASERGELLPGSGGWGDER
jgi:hypothetical protein